MLPSQGDVFKTLNQGPQGCLGSGVLLAPVSGPFTLRSSVRATTATRLVTSQDGYQLQRPYCLWIFCRFWFLAVPVPNFYCRNAREFSHANVFGMKLWSARGFYRPPSFQEDLPESHRSFPLIPLSSCSSKGQMLGGAGCNEMSLLFNCFCVCPKCWSQVTWALADSPAVIP